MVVSTVLVRERDPVTGNIVRQYMTLNAGDPCESIDIVPP